MHQFAALRASDTLLILRGTSAAEAGRRGAFLETSRQGTELLTHDICAAITAIVSEDLEFFTPLPEQAAETQTPGLTKRKKTESTL